MSCILMANLSELLTLVTFSNTSNFYTNCFTMEYEIVVPKQPYLIFLLEGLQSHIKRNC